MYLTKSDFKVAHTCPTKLRYKKLRYPSLKDDNPYLEFLADGGYMVESMAKLLYPGGREIGDWDRPVEAFAATRQALAAGNCVLFEATVICGNMLARVDILQRVGKTLRLIEVKSTSIDTTADEEPFRGKRGGIDSDYREYLEDVAFQTLVLRRAFPDFEVIPHLCVVDKARTATANNNFDKFPLTRTGRWRPRVDFLGDAKRLANEHVLAVLDVSDIVAELEGEITAAADELAATIIGESVERIPPVVGLKCKKCEYRLPLSVARNGFRECWGPLAEPDPHILDLYHIGAVGGRKTDTVARLAAEGKARLADVPEEILSGAFADRQRLQLECTAANREAIDPQLPQLLSQHGYPLHFVDFEGSRLALSYHAGMHPYEQAAFQWSCHTIRTPGGPLEHGEWLNDREAFPNFEFARALRARIGDTGTVYIWSHYEVDVLREIRRQMEDYGERDPDLAGWLDALTAKPYRRVVDMLELARAYYFHPMMKGSLSIKDVLPAVWQSDSRLQADPDFVQYVRRDPGGRLQSPYDALPPLPIGEQEEVVAEGTGAMRTYQELMYGVSAADPAARANYRRLLLQYCRLDTAAMVMIWRHWVG